jgi:transposase
MQKEQKTSTKELKVEAVQLLQSSQKSQAHIARELGVADSTLSQWRKDLTEHGNDAFPGSGHQTPLEEENRHVKRAGEIVRQERDLLKKALRASFRASQREICVHCGASGRVSGDADVQGS